MACRAGGGEDVIVWLGVCHTIDSEKNAEFTRFDFPIASCPTDRIVCLTRSLSCDRIRPQADGHLSLAAVIRKTGSFRNLPDALPVREVCPATRNGDKQVVTSVISATRLPTCVQIPPLQPSTWAGLISVGALLRVSPNYQIPFYCELRRKIA